MAQLNLMDRITDTTSVNSNIQPLIAINEYEKQDEIINKLNNILEEIKADRANIQNLITQANQMSLGQATPTQQPKTIGFLDNLIPGFNISNLLWIGIIGFLIYWFFIKDK